MLSGNALVLPKVREHPQLVKLEDAQMYLIKDLPTGSLSYLLPDLSEYLRECAIFPNLDRK